MSLPGLLIHTATIKLLEVAQTALGGADRTTATTVASGVPCRVSKLRPTLAALLSRRDDARAQTVDVRIYFASDPLAPSDALSTRHRIEVDGEAYAVSGVDDVDKMGRLLQVDCEKIA